MKEYYPEGFLTKKEENIRYLQSAAGLISAAAEGIILEAQAIMCDRSHNLTVDLGCMKGVITREEGAIGIDDGTTRDIAVISKVGKPVCFKVLGLDTDENGEPFARLSRKAAQIDCREYIRSSMICGDIINARITHLESFGAFCDIGCGDLFFQHLLTLILQSRKRTAAVLQMHLHLCGAAALHRKLFERGAAGELQPEHQSDAVNGLSRF